MIFIFVFVVLLVMSINEEDLAQIIGLFNLGALDAVDPDDFISFGMRKLAAGRPSKDPGEKVRKSTTKECPQPSHCLP